MKSRLILLLVAIIGLIPVGGESGELPYSKPEQVGMSSSGLRKIEESVGKHLDANRLSGAVTMVLKDGKVVHLESHGFRDLEESIPMTEDTIFRIYSMTKPVVSTVLMMLRDEGKFKLDDPVSKFIPELKGMKVHTDNGLVDAEREITVRDLMRHTAGMTYGFFGNTPVDQKYREAGVLSPWDDSDAFVKKLGQLPLLYQPGSKWVYSVSVDVQGVLIERLTGQSLAQALKKRVFDPLDMYDTGFSVPDDKIDRFATVYGPNREGGLQAQDKPATSNYRKTPKFFSGGGGLVSTIRDYSRFTQMLLNKGTLNGMRLVKASSIEEMTQNHLSEKAMPISIGEPRDGFGFGLGVYVVVSDKSKFDMGAVKHEYGWDGAASTHLWISPSDKLAVITMEQTRPFTRNLIDAVKSVVYDAIQ